MEDEQALRAFDKLVGLGVIKYGPTESVLMTDNGFPFDFRVCPGWTNKPLKVTDTVSASQPALEMFGPGSDIVKGHAEQAVRTINGTHTLALNAFPVFRPQYLLLQNNSYRSQNEPLEVADIEACWTFLLTAAEPHYAMYNCTKDGGCSRYHKHLQIMKKPESADLEATMFRFFPDSDASIEVPYVYFLRRLERSCNEAASTEVFDIYEQLLRECRQILGIEPDDKTTLCPHNAVFCKNWVLLIPRRSNECDGFGANAAGMLGMPTISSRELLQKWEQFGPVRALQAFGVPRARSGTLS